MNALLRLVGWLLALALVALPVVAVLNGWVGAERWPLTRLRLSGELQRVTPEQIRAAVMPYARAGYFAVKLDQAQAAVGRLPWVESAQVRKQWPDALVVQVSEHRPFAYWGEDRMLSEQGRLFPVPPGLQHLDLPHLGGADSQVAQVVELYNQARSLLAPTGQQVIALAQDARGSWSLRLGDGMQVVIGRDDARARLARFARVLPQLLGAAQPIVRADLRYTNGFTLQWGEAMRTAPAAPEPTRRPPLPAPVAGGARLAQAAPAPTVERSFPSVFVSGFST